MAIVWKAPFIMWNKTTPMKIPIRENTQSSISPRPSPVIYCAASRAAGKKDVYDYPKHKI